jgi:hypothetical protein
MAQKGAASKGSARTASRASRSGQGAREAQAGSQGRVPQVLTPEQAAARAIHEELQEMRQRGFRHDETKPGGHYIGVDGKPHDAEGRPIKDGGRKAAFAARLRHEDSMRYAGSPATDGAVSEEESRGLTVAPYMEGAPQIPKKMQETGDKMVAQRMEGKLAQTLEQLHEENLEARGLIDPDATTK